MNWNFVSYIVRDVFEISPNNNSPVTVIYGEDYDFQNILRTNTHGLGAYLFHSNIAGQIDIDKCKYYWPIVGHDFFLDFGVCGLFISINYNPPIDEKDCKDVADRIKNLMNTNGLIFLCNPGIWALGLSDKFFRRLDLEKEIKRYTIFKNEDVLIYENI